MRLGKRQQVALDYLRGPTNRCNAGCVAIALGCSWSEAERVLQSLVKRGLAKADDELAPLVGTLYSARELGVTA